jgi:hypothetical protein
MLLETSFLEKIDPPFIVLLSFLEWLGSFSRSHPKYRSPFFSAVLAPAGFGTKIIYQVDKDSSTFS